MINRSESSATRRLLQCTGFGLSMNDISAKFSSPPTQTPDLSYVDFMARKTVIDQVTRWRNSGHLDRSRPQWTPVLYLYEVCPLDQEILLILSVADCEWICQAGGKRRSSSSYWCRPACAVHSHRLPLRDVSRLLQRRSFTHKLTIYPKRDWGHLLFTEPTLSCFLIVMFFPEPCNCGNLSHHDYDAMTKFQADRMMSLATYLHDAWNWGRTAPKWFSFSFPVHERDV